MPKKEAKPDPVPEIPAHVHVWDILEAQNQAPQMLHPRLANSPITLVLVRCKECNLPQTVELPGTWTLEQILKNHARIIHRETEDGSDNA
jgi:hypothetical protein